MKRSIWKLFALFVLLTFWSCGDDPEPNSSRLGFQFFPLEIGLSSLYQVEEINYLVTGEVEVNNFQLKVDVVDSFIGQAGDVNYVIHRSTRPSESDEFTFLETWSARVNANNAIENEGSTSFIRMVFPIGAGQEWDGNALNVLDEDTYVMDSLFNDFVTIAQDTINNTLTVIEEDNQDFIVALDRRLDIYGENVGLVYREDIQLNYCTETDCIGQQIVLSGREYRQKLISHDKN